MPENWTLERLMSFALRLGALEHLDPVTIRELGAGLAFLVEYQADNTQRLAHVIETQAYTIQTQAATIERQQAALQWAREGVVLTDKEGDAP